MMLQNPTAEKQAVMPAGATVNGNGYTTADGNFFETGASGNPVGNNPNAPTGNAAKEADVIAGKAYKDTKGNIIYGTEPTPTTTMSSDAAAGDHKDVGNTITSEADIIRQEQDSLRQTLDANTAQIKADGENQDRQLAQTQTEENATNQATQFKLGRSSTDYANSATQKLNQLHLDQQSQMTSQRQALIGQANAAYRAGNVALAKELVANAKNVATQQAEAKKAQAEQVSRDLQNNINKQTLMTKTMENLATSNIPLTSITADAKSAYEKQFGIPTGAFDALYKASVSAANIKTDHDLLSAAKDIVGLASKIPEGETQDIKMSDGSIHTVTGTKSNHSASYKEWQDYQSTGGKLGYNDYQTMDKNRTRAVTINNPVTGVPDEVSTVLQATSKLLTEKYTGQDGKADTEQYARAYKDFAVKYPKYAAAFTKYFPPEAWINSDNIPIGSKFFGLASTAQ